MKLNFHKMSASIPAQRNKQQSALKHWNYFKYSSFISLSALDFYEKNLWGVAILNITTSKIHQK